jgi:hypothetical protein
VIWNNTNSKIIASFYGVGDNIAENGTTISFQTKENEAGEILKVSVSGKLTPSVSFVEWGLAPHKSYQCALVYLIPSSEQNVKIKFSYRLGNGKVYEKVSENISLAGSSCFIASAAFAPLSPEVLVLRNYRDRILNQNPIGRIFVSCYYKISPPLAYWVGGSPFRKSIARFFLQPLINIAKGARATDL